MASRPAPAGTHTHPTWLWAAPLGAVLAVAVPLWVALQPTDEPRDEVYALQLLLTCYAGASLVACVAAPRVMPLRMTFWFFVYVAMGLAPLAQAVLGVTPVAQIGSRAQLVEATVLVLTGCVAYDLASRWAVGRSAHLGARAPTSVSGPGTVVLAALALGGSAALVSVVGPTSLFSSREGIKDGFAAAGVAMDSQLGSASLRALGTVPVLVLLLLLTRRLVSDPAARARPVVLAGWWTALAVNVLVNNPVSNPRFWFLTVLFSVFLVAVAHRVWLFRLAVLVGLVGAVAVFPFADRFRYESGPTDRYQSESVIHTLAIKDYDQMTMFANTVTYAEEGPGHTSGRQLAGAVLFWVPRAIWDDKPVDTGVEVGVYMDNVNTNLSAPLWAELWLDLGPVGMALGLAAVGLVSGRLDGWYAVSIARQRHLATVGMLAVPLLAGYSFILLRGSLLQAMGRLALMALCLAILSAGLAAGDRGRGPGRRAGPPGAAAQQGRGEDVTTAGRTGG